MAGHKHIWWGIWAAGKRPGKLAKLDQTTGRITEYTIPEQNAQPYDVSQDLEGNIWFPDSPTADRGAMIGKFNPKDQTFTLMAGASWLTRGANQRGRAFVGCILGWSAPKCGFGEKARVWSFGLKSPIHERPSAL